MIPSKNTPINLPEQVNSGYSLFSAAVEKNVFTTTTTTKTKPKKPVDKTTEGGVEFTIKVYAKSNFQSFDTDFDNSKAAFHLKLSEVVEHEYSLSNCLIFTNKVLKLTIKSVFLSL